MGRKQIKKGDQQLLLVLACGATVDAAAKQLQLNPRTIYRRMTEPYFRRELAKIRGDMVARATGMLTAASIESVKTLLELQKNGTPAVKLGAAKAVIELSTKLREVVDLEANMLDLEAKVEAIIEAR